MILVSNENFDSIPFINTNNRSGVGLLFLALLKYIMHTFTYYNIYTFTNLLGVNIWYKNLTELKKIALIQCCKMLCYMTLLFIRYCLIKFKDFNSFHFFFNVNDMIKKERNICINHS